MCRLTTLCDAVGYRLLTSWERKQKPAGSGTGRLPLTLSCVSTQNLPRRGVPLVQPAGTALWPARIRSNDPARIRAGSLYYGSSGVFIRGLRGWTGPRPARWTPDDSRESRHTGHRSESGPQRMQASAGRLVLLRGEGPLRGILRGGNTQNPSGGRRPAFCGAEKGAAPCQCCAWRQCGPIRVVRWRASAEEFSALPTEFSGRKSAGG